MRSNLAVVIIVILKSESKRSPGTNLAAEDVNKNIRRESCIAANFEFRIESNRTAGKRSNIRNVEYSNSSLPYCRPIHISYLRTFDC